MLSHNKINRLLSSVIASMVVLSSIAQVEVQLPRHEVETMVEELRVNCELLMSDRAGQEALNRLLRQEKALPQATSATRCHTLHPAPGHIVALTAVQAALARNHPSSFIHIPIDQALLAPACSNRIRVRSPGALS